MRGDVRTVLDRRQAIRDKLRFLRDTRINATRIRIHGDYHLAQALYTGKDFVIIDFEGDLARPQSERRIKRSPLQDVAGMLDSFYHASHGVLFGETPGVIPKPESLNALESWAKFWYRSVRGEFLDAYLGNARGVSASAAGPRPLADTPRHLPAGFRGAQAVVCADAFSGTYSGAGTCDLGIALTLRVFGPRMPGIAAGEFLADLWVEALPEARQVAGHLHGTLIRRQEPDNHWDSAPCHGGRFAHAEEVLQARCDPRRLIGFVVDTDLSPDGQSDPFRGNLVQ